MILKELEPFFSSDKFARAGRAAEEQMAFYLRRAFETNPDVRVFNNIRLEKHNDAAQIDHLIVYRYGVIVIESKSVTSEVKINAQGEWSRLWGGRHVGMPSPVLQAQRQGLFLVRYLQDHAPTLLDKVLVVIQKNFGSLKVDTLVAISDHGLIQRAKHVHAEEVCKADQVTDRVTAIIEKMRQANGFMAASNYSLTEKELSRIEAFLIAHHRPVAKTDPQTIALEPQKPSKPATPQLSAAKPAKLWTCRSCSSEHLEVAFGRYGYYFKCRSCSSNTPIQQQCPGCQAKLKIRKSGLNHFLDCADCGSSQLFFTNPHP
jgi:Nuclease-related domain